MTAGSNTVSALAGNTVHTWLDRYTRWPYGALAYTWFNTTL